MSPTYVTNNQQLPSNLVDTYTEVVSKLDKKELSRVRRSYAVILKESGWTYQAISRLFGVSRESVRQMVSTHVLREGTRVNIGVESARGVVDSYGLAVENPPIKPEKEKKVYPMPDSEVLARLLELQPKAQQVRSSSPRFRQEAEEYTRLIYETHVEKGVSLYRLAKLLGVTHSALRFRLVRYGYETAKGTSAVYKPIVEKNRATAEKRQVTTVVFDYSAETGVKTPIAV